MTGIKFDNGKLRYDLVPAEWEHALAAVMTYGADKYGDNNWQALEGGIDRYYAALRRHLEAFRNGETDDPESGIGHLAHAMVNIGMMMYHASRTTKVSTPDTIFEDKPSGKMSIPDFHKPDSGLVKNVSFLEGAGHD